LGRVNAVKSFLAVNCVKVEWSVNISETVSSLHGLGIVYITEAFRSFLMTCPTDWHDLIEMYYCYYLFIYFSFRTPQKLV
jgi:Ca2+/Na+ antiporter